MNIKTNALSTKVLASATLVAAAATVSGLGAFAAFTSSTSASQADSTGTVIAALGTADGVDNRLTIGATKVAAGDSIQRVVKLTNGGTINWASASLTTTAPISSLLDTNTVNGLQMVVDKCAQAWTETGTGSPAAAPFTYTCDAVGGATSVIVSRPVIGSALPLGTLNALTATNSDFLRVTLTLPSAADNTFQGLSSTIKFTFDATQRTATSK